MTDHESEPSIVYARLSMEVEVAKDLGEEATSANLQLQAETAISTMIDILAGRLGWHDG